MNTNEKSVVLSVDHYLSMLDASARAVLQNLREQIVAAAPGAEEVISYGMPAYKLDGMLVGFAAFKKHLSFFTMSTAVGIAHAEMLKDYDTAPGTVRFKASEPLPRELVAKLVTARIAENKALKAAKLQAKALKKKK